ncbi:hypothetical protein PR202_gb07305 [Eleusine coracana subsp. coracana]|uniref:60S acidic ribosomal protein P2 n=1 Tax=Eleusine coracana subsp. coracana TaxID=191504 RepID=A0AAV5EBV8_ELECO|nr:hypothetical protein PR202_gb07305 [Eleusine coracana subsp. coracana]
MRFIAAYLLAQLGATSAPGKDDVRRILDSVGVNVDEDRLDMLFVELEGKDFAELMAAGREKLAYAPCAGAGMAVASAAPGAASSAGEAKEEDKEEEKMEEEDDENMFNLFDE